jgi:hypothetical protein
MGEWGYGDEEEEEEEEDPHPTSAEGLPGMECPRHP